MKSWEEGKKELQSEFNRICEVINENMLKGLKPLMALRATPLISITEIHSSATVQIGKEELRILQEDSAQIEKLVQNNARLTDELEKSRAVSAQVEFLKRDNQRLLDELHHQLQMPASEVASALGLIDNLQKTSNLVASPNNDINKVDHQRLLRKYDILSENCKQLKKAWKNMERKLREQKEINKGWEWHLQQKDAAIMKKELRIRELKQEVNNIKAKLGHDSPLTPLCKTDIYPCPLALNAKEKRPEMMPLNEHIDSIFARSPSRNFFVPDTLHDSKIPEYPSLSYQKNQENSKPDDSPNTVLDSPQKAVANDRLDCHKENYFCSLEETSDSSLTQKSTFRDLSILEQPSIELPASSEIPTIMKKHKLMKRKERHVSEDELPQLNTEKITSSQIGTHGLRYFNDSIDLDEIGTKFGTPRKQCRWLETLSNSRESSLNFVDPRRKTRKQSYLNYKKTNQKSPRRNISKSQDRIGHNESPNTLTVYKQNTSQNLINQLPTSRNQATGEFPENEKHDWTPVGVSSALKIKENFNTLEKASLPELSISSTNSSQTEKGQLSLNIESVVSSPSKVKYCKPSRPRLFRDIARNTRIMDSPLPKDSVSAQAESFRPSSQDLSMIHTPKQAHSPPTKTCNLYSSLEKSKINFTEPAKSSPRQHFDKKFAKSEKKNDPRERQLRDFPIEKLNIWDFKINPDYNLGYQYAFSEVVRGNARNELRGCLKPCCEPKYRALAEISRNPNKTPSSSQEEADQLALEEFMGDNAYKLHDMCKAERDELLIQARTRDLANKHGNHRQLYENPESPVGIWRADFPTTQEANEEEKKVQERKRKIVERRYAEAMRPGGAYKFRDE